MFKYADQPSTSGEPIRLQGSKATDHFLADFLFGVGEVAPSSGSARFSAGLAFAFPLLLGCARCVSTTATGFGAKPLSRAGNNESGQLELGVIAVVAPALPGATIAAAEVVAVAAAVAAAEVISHCTTLLLALLLLSAPIRTPLGFIRVEGFRPRVGDLCGLLLRV